MSEQRNFDVAIAGAGPAGTSAAIQLALNGAAVLLIEEKKFPRPKLCGEFISPECVEHFQRLGVKDEMFNAGATSISETVFYSQHGKSVTVPSDWFKTGGTALGLSRSEMDHKLLERARSLGVTILEETRATDLLYEGERVLGIKVKSGEVTTEYFANVCLDATGRNRSLARYGSVDRTKGRARFVAFKAHLENARVSPGACEIYFYRGGYGGLNAVEAGASNLCFIVSANDVKRMGSDADAVMREVVMSNARAAYTLAESSLCSEWLSVSLETFGRQSLSPAPGLLTVGDAAAFIDPFSGSGMLMALESGQLAADVISRFRIFLRQGDAFDEVARQYQIEYVKKFQARLRICGMLRRAAFVPYLAQAAILFFGSSTLLRRKLARATRPSQSHTPKAATGV
ncbi:MAG TPA: NAD(P)/FAD-dependent oxidoreductase [Pyrinomonadaceae bacterium]|nr:NAD(P)/FAD-dependent oxidoreductase [Pyrinomonadaceae bacterium]